MFACRQCRGLLVWRIQFSYTVSNLIPVCSVHSPFFAFLICQSWIGLSKVLTPDMCKFEECSVHLGTFIWGHLSLGRAMIYAN